MADNIEDREAAPTGQGPELVVITGMSGAGRSEAIHTFEDLGYFCIDNLPPSFISQVVELTTLPGSRIDKVAVVCDVRAMEFFSQLYDALVALEDAGIPFKLLFLEADDKTLVSRFKQTRRRHPLREAASTIDGIRAERTVLHSIRGRADLILDTSDLTTQQLRTAIREQFLAERASDALAVSVESFGFKYGLPIDADIVMDVRFLPNPFYVRRLRSHTGLSKPVRRFVLERSETEVFLQHWFGLLDSLLPSYLAEGKTHLLVALGCTGGMHRSVVLAEETAAHLRALGYMAGVAHRDIAKDQGAK
ncbi:MAG: RNase adapter RapZ [Coriobacteriia bacterium]